MKYLFSMYLEYVVALNLLISPFRKINYYIYSVAKWFRVHFKYVEGFGHWHYTQPDAFFPFFSGVVSYDHFIFCLCSVLNMM